MCLASCGSSEFGCFQSVARSAQKSIAQGLPWVIPPNRISPEGATRYRTFAPDRVNVSSPFRAKRLFWLTQGKPWAKLSCPFGAEPSGRITDANRFKAWAMFPWPFGPFNSQKKRKPIPALKLCGICENLQFHFRTRLDSPFYGSFA